MKPRAKELDDYIKEQIQFQENIAAEIEKNANISRELIAKLEEMLEANARLEEMPLFDMMVTYAQRAEYELGDQIYAEEEMDVADLVKQSMKLFYGYRDAVAMLQEDIEEILV
jgi:predicted nuclease with TOPRIM domain